jgi:hypothetical protein
MSAPTRIDPRAAAPTQAPADETALTRLCSFCGLIRVFEGGRPPGFGPYNDCRECGGRLAIMPEDWAAVAKCAPERKSVRASIDRDLF